MHGRAIDASTIAARGAGADAAGFEDGDVGGRCGGVQQVKRNATRFDARADDDDVLLKRKRVGGERGLVERLLPVGGGGVGDGEAGVIC